MDKDGHRERVWRRSARAACAGVWLTVLLSGVGCSSGGARVEGDALSVSRYAGATPAERVEAIGTVRAEVASGERDRMVVRHAMTEMAWALDTPEVVRAAALEVLLWDEASEADSLTLVQEMLPTEPGRGCVAVMSTAIADHGWIEATPALVRSFARPVEGVADRERSEYRAMKALYPETPIERVALGVFLEPGVDEGPAGLQLDMRTREAGWDVLGRLAPDEGARGALLGGAGGGDEEGAALLGKLRDVYAAFGVVPGRAEEMRWAVRLADGRSGELAGWWDDAASGVSGLTAGQRDGLGLRHLEAVRWARVHEPAWLGADRDALLDELADRLRGRQVYTRTASIRGIANANAERLSTARDGLVWGDVLVLLVVDEALADDGVRGGVFAGAEDDNRDRTTEHGGTLWSDADGFHVQPFSPRGTATPDDRRFVAPREMIDYSSAALVHFHYHVSSWRNREYAGPSPGDQDYAARFGRACVVFSGVSREILNADVYFPGGAVVDLGEVRRAAAGR